MVGLKSQKHKDMISEDHLDELREIKPGVSLIMPMWDATKFMMFFVFLLFTILNSIQILVSVNHYRDLWLQLVNYSYITITSIGLMWVFILFLELIIVYHYDYTLKRQYLDEKGYTLKFAEYDFNKLREEQK